MCANDDSVFFLLAPVPGTLEPLRRHSITPTIQSLQRLELKNVAAWHAEHRHITDLVSEYLQEASSVTIACPGSSITVFPPTL